TIFNPYNKELVGTVELVSKDTINQAIEGAIKVKKNLSRYHRYNILNRAYHLLEKRKEEFATLITSESGLCIRESLYETERTLEVLKFASIGALEDDGGVFSCDISPYGKDRKIFTIREPRAL